ncbi:MAG TPA: DsbA family protein [Chloroflexota bacterium]|nr:DsbA family protein [Chloroflexota bacterium]
MYDYLVTHQRPLDDDHLLMAAAAIGLGTAQFAYDMTHRAQVERVRADVAGGQQSGVRGTPTFFVNGVWQESPSDLEVERVAIAAALAAASGGSG